MLFTPNQTLRDGYETYEAGQEYDAPEDRVKYLVSLGWGVSPDLPAELGNWSEPATVTLQPHDAGSTTDSEV